MQAKRRATTQLAAAVSCAMPRRRTSRRANGPALWGELEEFKRKIISINILKTLN